MMTEIDEQFNGADGAFKSSVYKAMPLHDLISSRYLNLWDIMLYRHIND